VHVDTTLLGLSLQTTTVLIIANTTDVVSDARSKVAQHPLSSADGVLRSTASDVFDVLVLHDLVVQRKVSLISQAGSTQSQFVLVQKGLISVDGDVQERVADRENSTFHYYVVDCVVCLAIRRANVSKRCYG
jgi:hypothetical protein